MENNETCEYTGITFKSEGYDEAYTRYLERCLKHRTSMMWWAFLGWVLTLVWYNL